MNTSRSILTGNHEWGMCCGAHLDSKDLIPLMHHKGGRGWRKITQQMRDTEEVRKVHPSSNELNAQTPNASSSLCWSKLLFRTKHNKIRSNVLREFTSYGEVHERIGTRKRRRRKCNTSCHLFENRKVMVLNDHNHHASIELTEANVARNTGFI